MSTEPDSNNIFDELDKRLMRELDAGVVTGLTAHEYSNRRVNQLTVRVWELEERLAVWERVAQAALEQLATERK